MYMQAKSGHLQFHTLFYRRHADVSAFMCECVLLIVDIPRAFNQPNLQKKKENKRQQTASAKLYFAQHKT